MGLFDRITSVFHNKTDTTKILETQKNNPPAGYHEVIADPLEPINDFPETYRCRTCGKLFSSKQELEDHHKSQKISSMPIQNADVEEFVCTDCGKKFDSRANLLNHMHVSTQDARIINEEINDSCLNHSGFLCKVCGRYFSTEYELQNHIHRPEDILAASDQNIEYLIPNAISGTNTQIDTQFVYRDEVNMKNLGSERLRYDKFKGKIGYTPKKKS